MMSSFTGLGAEETEPVIYIRHTHNRGYSWSALKTDVDLSNEPSICHCGAKDFLKSCFRSTERCPINSSIAAVGSKIYSFGGYKFDRKRCTGEVSCIDTLCPEKGWQMMKTMPAPLRLAYPVTIDENRVLLVGGVDMQYNSAAQSHMYYADTDTCVPLCNYFELPVMQGHGVVDDRGEKYVLMHSYCSPGLFSYDVGSGRWNQNLKMVLEAGSYGSAVVDDIYYVLDTPGDDNPLMQFCGYDITLKYQKRLPVEIELDKRKKDVEWIPTEDTSGVVATAKLLPLGNRKLAMVWCYFCRGTLCADDRLCVCCSIFEMTKVIDNSGGLKSVALPLSNTRHHLEGWAFHGCVLVNPSKVTDNLRASRKRKMIEEESKNNSGGYSPELVGLGE